MGKAGRPTKLTPEVQAAFLEATELGGSVADAAAYADISTSTAFNWMSEGQRAKSGRKREFWIAVKRARVRRKMNRLGTIAAIGMTGRTVKRYDRTGRLVSETHDPGDWRALSWLLAHEHPEEYSSKSPLFLLHHLRRLAGSEADADGAWQHLADVVARSMASLKPFGPAAERPEEEVDEAELRTELLGEGMPESMVEPTLELLTLLAKSEKAAPDQVRRIESGNGAHEDNGHSGNGAPG